MASDENIYFLTSFSLLIEGGLYISKNILRRECQKPYTDLDKLLKNNKHKFKRFFHQKQYEQLYPKSGKADISNWDLQLSVGVLINVFERDLTLLEKDKLRRLRELRNETFMHCTTAALDKREYEEVVKVLDDIITTLASTFDISVQQHCSNCIKQFTSGPLDGAAVKQTLNEISQSCQKTIKVGVETELVISGPSSDLIDLCEHILKRIFNHAESMAGEEGGFKEIEEIVKKMLSFVESNNTAIFKGCEKKCIILSFECKDFESFLNFLKKVECQEYKCYLDELSYSLNSFFKPRNPISITSKVTSEFLQLVLIDIITTKEVTMDIETTESKASKEDDFPSLSATKEVTIDIETTESKASKEDDFPLLSGSKTEEIYSLQRLVDKKRNDEVLNKKEMEYFVKCATQVETYKGQGGGYAIQMEDIGDMLKAIYDNKLNEEETSHLTKAMINSGIILRWPADWTVVDKHSTGGVGDKVSLVLAPVLAACGLKVPMISGRGLKHTGGTLDKLESIPGFKVMQEEEDMLRILTRAGCCIVSQTSQLVPADKLLYVLRNETETVNEHGLITGSIISRKAAVSPDALVLDVKFGIGALCKTKDAAKTLSEKMVKAGNSLGVKTVALVTDMNSPLGYTIGNALEVAESIKCLQGEGPEDLIELVKLLGGQLLVSVKKATSLDEAYDLIESTLRNGKAINNFEIMLKEQGVQPEIAGKLCEKGTDIFTIIPKSKQVKQLKAEFEGYVHGINAMKCGLLSAKLGANRINPGDVINPAVGLVLHTHVGKRISKGSPWVEIHYDNELPDNFLQDLQSAIDIRPDAIKRQSRLAYE